MGKYKQRPSIMMRKYHLLKTNKDAYMHQNNAIILVITQVMKYSLVDSNEMCIFEVPCK